MSIQKEKDTLRRIEDKYPDAESSFDFFVSHAKELGITNANKGMRKVSVRDERTPSAAISKYLKYCDFGDDAKQHSVIDLIKSVYGVKFPKAVEILAKWDGEEVKEGAPQFERVVKKDPPKPPFKGWFFQKTKEYAEAHKREFWQLLKGTFRACTVKEIVYGKDLFEVGLYEFSELTGGVLENGEKEKEVRIRLVIPERDHKGIPWNIYKYNRGLDPKGKFRRKGKRVLFASHLPTKFERPLIFTEGHTDCLVCRAKGMQAVTSGSASTPIPEDDMPFLEGRMIHFYYDADLAGMQGVTRKIIQINKYNEANQDDEGFMPILYKVFWWAEFYIDKKTGEKIAFDSDFLTEKQKKIYASEGYDPKNSDLIQNWKVLKRGTVKGGYDFIDFHSDHMGTIKYKSLIEKYVI